MNLLKFVFCGGQFLVSYYSRMLAFDARVTQLLDGVLIHIGDLVEKCI